MKLTQMAVMTKEQMDTYIDKKKKEDSLKKPFKCPYTMEEHPGMLSEQIFNYKRHCFKCKFKDNYIPKLNNEVPFEDDCIWIVDNEEFRTDEYSHVFGFMKKHYRHHFTQTGKGWASYDNPLYYTTLKFLTKLFGFDQKGVTQTIKAMGANGRSFKVVLNKSGETREFNWVELLRYIMKQLNKSFKFWLKKLSSQMDKQTYWIWYREIKGKDHWNYAKWRIEQDKLMPIGISEKWDEPLWE